MSDSNWGNTGERVRFHGVLPVVETPFTKKGDVDCDSFEALLGHLVSTPITGLMFPGFASEFSKLSRDERHELGLMVVHATREVSGVASVLSVPDHATRIAVEEAQWAVENGADALNLLPPFFLAPRRDEIVAHLHEVLGAVPETPVIVQLAPGLTGSAFSAEDLARLSGDHPNLAAVKVEAVPPGRMVSQFGELAPNLPCLVGYAGLYLPDSLRRGAVGVQPGCSVIELYHLLWSYWITGDTQSFHALHERMAPYLLDWMASAEYIVQVEKSISVRRGLIRSDFCRSPGYRLDRFESASIDRFLNEFAPELSLT